MADDLPGPAPDPFVERGVAMAKAEMAKEPHRALPMMEDIVAAIRGALAHVATWPGGDKVPPPDDADHDTGPADPAAASPPPTAW